MNIGWVKQKEANINNETVKWLELTVRYPGGSFTSTLTKVKEKQQDNSPDYSIYFSPNRRGEHYERAKCGSLWMKTSEKGNPYLSGYIESPAFDKGKIYLSIVKYTPQEGKPPEDKLYNVLWSPPQEKSENDYGYSPSSYTPPASGSDIPNSSVRTSSGADVPVEIEIDEDQIPF